MNFFCSSMVVRTGMSVQEVTQDQRLVPGNGVAFVHAERGPHPAVLAHMPVRGVTRVRGMVEVRDAFDDILSIRPAAEERSDRPKGSVTDTVAGPTSYTPRLRQRTS